MEFCEEVEQCLQAGRLFNGDQALMFIWQKTGLPTVFMFPGYEAMGYDQQRQRPVFIDIGSVFNPRAVWMQQHRQFMLTVIDMMAPPYTVYARMAMSGVERRFAEPGLSEQEELLDAERSAEAAKRAFSRFRMQSMPRQYELGRTVIDEQIHNRAKPQTMDEESRRALLRNQIYDLDLAEKKV